MRRGNLVLSSLSALIGLGAIAAAVTVGDALAAAVGVIFLLNAAVRWVLARRPEGTAAR